MAKYEIKPFPLFEISGPPFQRGLQYGEQAREKIIISVELYTDSLRYLGLNKEMIGKLSEQFLPKINRWAPDLFEEMKGTAKGASLSLSEIVMINARTEIMQLAERNESFLDQRMDGCTGAIIMPKLSANNEIIHGQNWDWKEECINNGIVLRILRNNGPDVLTFTEAGALARSGLNSSGISITANYLKCNRDYQNLGIPLPLIRRRALECNYYSDAMRFVATTEKSGSNNMMLASSEGMGINFECAPDESFAILPDEYGLIVHANHWQHVAALSKLKDTGIHWSPDSFYRDYRVKEYLIQKNRKLDANDLKDALFDKFGEPYSVCIPPFTNAESNPGATVAMIIMQPKKGLMEIAPFPALSKTFNEYCLRLKH